jgi:predicted Zn-dependent peptidase
VGHIDPTKAEELVRKYFESIPPGKSLPAPAGSTQETDRDFSISRFTDSLESPLSTSPAFFLGFRIPSPRSSDFYALNLIEYILMRGNSSRLINRLVKKDSLATRLTGGIDVRGDQAAFRIFVVSSNELKAERCQNEILSEISKLKAGRISDDELQKAKNLLRMDFVSRYTTSVKKALFLIRSYSAGIAWEDMPAELDRYLAVTPIRIIYTMNKYFNEDRILIHVKTR